MDHCYFTFLLVQDYNCRGEIIVQGKIIREMQNPFNILEHPSDLGIEAYGKTLAEAFENAAKGLISIILDSSTIKSSESKTVSLSGGNYHQLFVKWLSEVLYLYDGQHFVGGEFMIHELTPNRLKASVSGEIFSETKHQTRLDVKAVTYHQLFIHQADDGCLVRVYLDV